MMETERFPRGGRINHKAIKRPQDDILFQYPVTKKKKQSTPKEKGKRGEDSGQISMKLHGTLTYDKVQEGMIILACVRRISNLAVEIEFPGFVYGVVTINRISDAFTKFLAMELKKGNDDSYSALKKILKFGDIVPAKILSISRTEKGHEIQASLSPKDINSNKTYKMFKKGVMVWANVVSNLEHGYELSVGVKHCRVFLPYKNVDPSKSYVVGELLYCVIHKADISDTATTLTVSAKQEHLDIIQFKHDVNIDDVIPGTKVEFLVDKKLAHGIKGTFLENCSSYLDETQTFEKVDKNKIIEGVTTLTAHVLFIEPMTKMTYLTLRDLKSTPKPDYETGKIMSAQVVSSVSRGLYLKLGKNHWGFITNKRLLKTLPRDATLDIANAVKKKYPAGSHHACRILDYNHMQQIYICTFEQSLVKEEVFSPKNLKLGQKVSVTIIKIVPNGLVVKIGHVQGFVPNLHLSNVKYTDTIKKKYSEGMTVEARVLNITPEEKVFFTLKQGLVESEKCLTDLEQASSHSQYVGFVVHTRLKGALIVFYGGIKGWISKTVLNSGNYGPKIDPRKFFFLGQVVSVWITGRRDDQMLRLSLSSPNCVSKRINVGDIGKGTVTKIHQDGVSVEIKKRNVEGVVPLAHLGSNLLLNSVLLKTFQIGDVIKVMCTKNWDTPTLSRREYLAYKKNNTKVPKLKELRRDLLLRCSFEDRSNSGIFVSAPIIGYKENIEISQENLVSNQPSYEKFQPILAKVLSGNNYLSKKVTLTTDIDNDIKLTCNLLASVLEDLDHIIKFAQSNNWALTKYKIGDHVECRVKNVDKEGNCLVILPNKIDGLIPAHLSNPNMKVGNVVVGVVLDYNFIDNYVEICCQNKLKHSINNIQDGDVSKPLLSFCHVNILLYTKFYVVGILKTKECNRQLIYLPLFVNENGHNIKFMYESRTKLKVRLESKVGNRLIGLPKKLIDSFSKPKPEKEKVVLHEDVSMEEEIINEDHEEVDDQLNEDNEELDDQLNEDDEELDQLNEDNEELDQLNEDDDQSDISSTGDFDDSQLSESDEENISADNAKQPHVTELKMDVDENLDKSCKCEPRKPKVQNTSGILPGIESFYQLNIGNSSDESSEDEDTEATDHVRKSGKMTKQEKRELSKKEEEKISKIEKELLDATSPETAEQFDRLLLANPNSSELWLRYMAMHIATTELEKARAVARRALDTIGMTLVDEKYNVWMGLLNLENMYGTKESFEKVFEDAVKYNDSLKVYLNVIKLLATSGKLTEMEEKIKKIRSKEKQNSKMWLEIARVYYSLEKYREARNIKEAALKSILDKKRQFDLIVKFGIMEFQMGELEQAVANFETILETYPSKINIWILYVDQLIKKKKIDDARNVLERASKQKFPVKSMKAIFQKFITFEEQFGSQESVAEVKRKAKEYVKCLN